MRTRNKLAAAILAAFMSLGVVACAEGDGAADPGMDDGGMEEEPMDDGLDDDL